ncbi:MAG: type II toxin-antitoxin system Phd/YefM family antitoxin [Chloroflexi bacterium]|nr:MAG: type II toxin-antitoxin system Phd/YefM family antitoxin [Chloroflexota bacterium]
MPKTIEIKEAKARYALPLDEAQLAEEPLIVEREGKPIAAIIPYREYQKFIEWQRRERATTWQEEQERLLHKEIAAFERMKPDLLNTHKGKQVAILNGQVVDSDEDKRALAKRVYAKYGYRTILMTEVRESPRVYRIDSPEVKR